MENHNITVQACYERMHGDYQDVLRRLGNDARIQRILSIFLRDDSFDKLGKALEAQDYNEAFRAIHTLKGVSLNLSFTPLIRSSVPLTEALRNGQPSGDVAGLYAQVAKDYHEAVAAVNWLLGNSQQ